MTNFSAKQSPADYAKLYMKDNSIQRFQLRYGPNFHRLMENETLEIDQPIMKTIDSEESWWLDCRFISKYELTTLQEKFAINASTINTIFEFETDDKFEIFENYKFLVLNAIDHEYENHLDHIKACVIILNDNRIITINFNELHSFNDKIIYRLNKFITCDEGQNFISSDWILYGLIDEIINSFIIIINRIEIEIDFIEDSLHQIKVMEFSKMLEMIGALRKTIIKLMRSIIIKRQVLKKLLNYYQMFGEYRGINFFYYDINDHLISMIDKMKLYEKLLSRCHSNYLAQLQVKSFNSNLTITKIFSKLTLIGTISVPLMVISSLFGMNVKVPGQEVDSLAWFFGIIGFMVLIISTLLFMLRKWLKY